MADQVKPGFGFGVIPPVAQGKMSEGPASDKELAFFVDAFCGVSEPSRIKKSRVAGRVKPLFAIELIVLKTVNGDFAARHALGE